MSSEAKSLAHTVKAMRPIVAAKDFKVSKRDCGAIQSEASLAVHSQAAKATLKRHHRDAMP